ncbi:B3 domain-containing protein Os04g0386900 [Cajanus cajan]|nr:B3 domain-containing protein Os04g0386900 [Cajanus cajan]XP_020238353.1 B3 domain-containing protein Os04g0386900 [Cajanus cajan]
MSSRRSSRRVASGGVALENRVSVPLLPDPTTNLEWDEVKPLSGKPHYEHLLSRSNLSPRYNMGPSSNILSELPSHEVPTILIYGDKSWDLVYNGQSNRQQKTFGTTGWKKFAVDTCLKVGDACIFELIQSSDKKIIFQVQILRSDIPSKFLENEKLRGQIREMPIVLS